VAVLLQQENELDPQLEDFLTLCMQYLSLPD
jgi:hypothetical protein